jgi:NAD(P)-dependent dehydrogenase (short-subunit alcohol dehydrogenase family)
MVSIEELVIKYYNQAFGQNNMVYTFDLVDKVILVTGGYGHLGKAMTESLVFHNAIVYVLGRNKLKFNEVFQSNSNLHFVNCDISDPENIKKSLDEVLAKEGRIDTIINNAFYSRGQSPEDMLNEDFAYCLDGSLSSVFRMIKAAIPIFKKQNYGKIINVSSMYGLVAPQFDAYSEYPEYLNPPHYGAAKAGVIQLTKYYASYLGRHNIQINCVTPGPFPSNIVLENQGFVKELERRTCLGRIGTPEDLAGTFVFLASDASNFITGQNIIVDGGWTTT